MQSKLNPAEILVNRDKKTVNPKRFPIRLYFGVTLVRPNIKGDVVRRFTNG
jgi:hypothetical protein